MHSLFNFVILSSSEPFHPLQVVTVIAVAVAVEVTVEVTVNVKKKVKVVAVVVVVVAVAVIVIKCCTSRSLPKKLRDLLSRKLSLLSILNTIVKCSYN